MRNIPSMEISTAPNTTMAITISTRELPRLAPRLAAVPAASGVVVLSIIEFIITITPSKVFTLTIFTFLLTDYNRYSNEKFYVLAP